MKDPKWKWKGYAMRSWPSYDDDGITIYDYEALIDGQWVEVLSEAYDFDPMQAQIALDAYLLKTKK
jgi:hypothetical protein